MAGGNQRARTAVKTSRKADPFDERMFANRNDRHLTPLKIIRPIGPFDLDPCGAPNPEGDGLHATANTVWIPEEVGDGLSHEWFGRVWLNPPFGKEARAWVERLVTHDGGGVALLPVATGIKLWQEVVFPYALAIHWYVHRVRFIQRSPDMDDKMVAPAATALIAFHPFDADKLASARLPGFTHRYIEESR